ncbi:MAG: hypothetical protein LBV44_01425 [Methylobacillus sp.]|jgi:hypothetical protein|nr:hypothetical protein [Methylobacillus sp.]
MNMIARITLFAIAATAISGCDLLDSGLRWKSGKFEIGWKNIHSDSSLIYRLDATNTINIVTACVFAAGVNDQYIVVEQHPLSNPATLNYYVLAKALYDPEQRSNDEALAGPLTEDAYREMSTRLALPKLESVIPESECRGTV